MPSFQILNDRFLAGEGSGGEPDQILDPQLCCYLEHLVRHQIAVTEVMVRRDGHTITQSGGDERSLQVGQAFVTIGGIIGAGGDGRAILASLGPVLAHALVRDNGLAIDFGRDHAPDSIFYEVLCHDFGICV